MLRKVDSVFRYKIGKDSYTIYIISTDAGRFCAESDYFESVLKETAFDAAWEVVQQIEDYRRTREKFDPTWLNSS